MPDGRSFQMRDWVLYYVSLEGQVLTFWKAPEELYLTAAMSAGTGGIINEADEFVQVDPLAFHQIRELKKSTPPNYINVTDCIVESVGIFKKGKSWKCGWK
jgi:hypothetical protein